MLAAVFIGKGAMMWRVLGLVFVGVLLAGGSGAEEEKKSTYPDVNYLYESCTEALQKNDMSIFFRSYCAAQIDGTLSGVFFAAAICQQYQLNCGKLGSEFEKTICFPKKKNKQLRLQIATDFINFYQSMRTNEPKRFQSFFSENSASEGLLEMLQKTYWCEEGA
ncbi:MAG: hypothetical protein MK052_12540 [Alphaproteobacteria bacterium]|nr:hypothetical protein [Alphaproteobacteria bacterium]